MFVGASYSGAPVFFWVRLWVWIFAPGACACTPKSRHSLGMLSWELVGEVERLDAWC
jgi:hypothetical protein